MNNIDEVYKDIIMENGTYKKYLKDLISENIENVVFLKHTQKYKAEQLIADTTQSKNISQLAENFPSEHDLKIMWNIASEIRKTLRK